MTVSLSQDQPIAIAIMALGGQGGGVMQSWLVDLAEQQGWVAQSTSVPGVAQRTGATVYYVEMMRKTERPPVLSLMPIPGMVDLVVAAEWMEAGRAIQRGFVTPDRTCLVASTHRSYSVSEKSVPGDGLMDPKVVGIAVDAAAKSVFSADMAALAEKNGSVISASTFGAIAASGALPFSREAFEDAIRTAGIGVKSSLAAFAAGYDAVLADKTDAPPAREIESRLEGGTSEQKNEYDQLKARVIKELPEPAHKIALIGLARVIDFQDTHYGAQYLEELQKIHTADREHGGAAKGFEVTCECAKYLAGAMAYSDVIRVADLKIRTSRFERIRKEVSAGDEQIVAMTEFLHPRVEEMCSMMPEKWGRRVQSSKVMSSIIGTLFAGGKRVRTDSIRGFVMLYMMAGLRKRRPASLRHATEMAHIGEWLQSVHAAIEKDTALAVEIIRCRRLIKGYSDTHERGLSKYDKIMQGVDALDGRDDAAEWVARLRNIALKDVDGDELDGALKTIGSFATEAG